MRIALNKGSVLNWCFILTFLVFISANARAENDQYTKRALEDLRYILKHRKPLGYIKNMLDTLYNDFNDMHKRACLVGGGMFHSCDYKDILEGAQDQNHYAFQAPGRKRRSVYNSQSTHSDSASSNSLTSSLLKKLLQTTRRK